MNLTLDKIAALHPDILFWLSQLTYMHGKGRYPELRAKARKSVKIEFTDIQLDLLSYCGWAKYKGPRIAQFLLA